MASEPLGLTLGVEIEALADRNDALQLLCDYLHQNAIPARIARTQKDTPTIFDDTQWVLSEDMTVVPDSDSDVPDAEPLGIELRWPIFYDDGTGGAG